MFNFSKNKKVIIVAEISANHAQNFKRAVSLIEEAKECGADAVKFQAYTPDTLTIDVDNKYFRIEDHPQWGGQTLYQEYKKAYTPWKWFKELKKISDDLGLEFFATAFDRTAVDFLEELDVRVHKIASFELVDIPLIEYAAKTGKPLILSTGMADFPEISEAVAAARQAGAAKIALLKCTTTYPADPRQMNLRTMADMKKRFSCSVGLSDHTMGIAVSLAAVALGAIIIEKHFILSRKRQTLDSFYSIEPSELKELVDNVRLIEDALGEISYKVDAAQKKFLLYRRSLFVTEDIEKGETVTEKNVRSIRPAQGMKPKYLQSIIGKKAKKNIKKGTPVRRGLFS